MSYFEILSALFVVTVTFVLFFRWKFRYWKIRNLECCEEPIIPFGNALDLWRDKFVIGNIIKRMYDAIKQKGLKHAGGYASFYPMYMPIDPDIIKTVMAESYENFSQRLYKCKETDDVFTACLLFATDDRWKRLRTKSAPAFTPAKMRILVDGVVHCSKQMLNELDSRNDKSVDFLQISLCHFTNVIGVTVYGIDCNCFEDPNLEFIRHVKNLVTSGSKYPLVKIFLKMSLPQLCDWLRLPMFVKESCEFFVNLAKDIARFRKQNNVRRNDLFQLLLDAETDLNLDELDDETTKSGKIIQEMASQSSMYFLAGLESSSVTLTFCLYELSQNLTIQEKVREEIDRVLLKYEGKITYDAIMEMSYMSQVLSETLRKYPVAPTMSRICTKEYKICETVIEKGMFISIPIIGLHHDPEYYPDPEKFDPERFSEENKQKIKPFTYLPFGEGPKGCPAYRYGLMQLKVGLTSLLQRYRFTLNSRTKVPIEMAPGTLSLMPKSEIILNIENRNVCCGQLGSLV